MLRTDETIEAAAERISRRWHKAISPERLQESGRHFRELRERLVRERAHGR